MIAAQRLLPEAGYEREYRKNYESGPAVFGNGPYKL